MRPSWRPKSHFAEFVLGRIIIGTLPYSQFRRSEMSSCLLDQPLTQTVALPQALLRDQVAIVTGGSRGIGRATALRLAEAGAHVIVNYARQQSGAEEVVRSCEELGVKAFAARADVSDFRQAKTLVETALEHFGRLDLLVANAGIWQGAPLVEMSEEIWDRVIETNLKGTWAICRAAVPVMKGEGHGAIIVVSSTAGQRGEAGYSNYAASKGGQISFTK